MKHIPDDLLYEAHFVVENNLVVKSRTHPTKLGETMTLNEFTNEDIKNSLFIDKDLIRFNRFTGFLKRT